MSRASGNQAEKKAAEFLQAKGYKIIELNFLARFGEIDIVTEFQNTIVFVEVKMRSSAMFGTGREFVTPKKLHKIILTANLYLKQNNLTKRSFRIDVIEIQGEKITHLENITM